MPTPNPPSAFNIIPVPAPAAAIGATRLCYGPALLTSGLNVNAYDYNFLGATPLLGGQSSTNPDGSVLISGLAGNGYGASICSARKVGALWQGFAFGGDSYLKIRAKFVPTLDPTGGGHLPFPALWALCIRRLMQEGGRDNWPELDMMQWPRNTLLYVAGVGWIYWSLTSSVTVPNNGEVKLNGLNLAEYQDYGMRWEKATPTKPGFLRNYINDIEMPYAVGKPYPITWPYGDPAGMNLDGSQLAIIAGTHPSCQMTIASACLWSRAAANNRVQ